MLCAPSAVRAGAVEFGHIALCVSCYAEKGSCCPEFGKDDLWRQREPVPAKAPHTM